MKSLAAMQSAPILTCHAGKVKCTSWPGGLAAVLRPFSVQARQRFCGWRWWRICCQAHIGPDLHNRPAQMRVSGSAEHQCTQTPNIELQNQHQCGTLQRMQLSGLSCWT